MNKKVLFLWWKGGVVEASPILYTCSDNGTVRAFFFGREATAPTIGNGCIPYNPMNIVAV